MNRATATRMVILIAAVLIPSLVLAEGSVEKGKVLYQKKCAVCHGVEGKGDGPGARLLDPKPRDFTKGIFKLRSTTTLPTDSDLLRTITEGMPATSMRSWESVSEAERPDLVAFIKSLSPRFTEERPGPPLQIPQPPPRSEKLLALGREYFREAGCVDCHGATGKGDGPSAPTLKDDWGYPTRPPDLTVPGRMKRGSTIQDIYRTLTAGMGGTPMPSYAASLEEQQRWGLGYYVLSLAGKPVPTTPAYVGVETCKVCHSDQFQTFSTTLMGKVLLKSPRDELEKRGCEACHGPGSAHLAEGARLLAFTKDSPQPVAERNAVCLQCHERGLRVYWKGSPHESRDLACTNCHRIMVKVSEKTQFVKQTEMETCFQCHLQRRAQLQRSSHMPYREGKITCTNCHNPHGTVTEKLLKANSVNEVCYQCHTEKRGPFLWEHAPVRENCLNCHEPHGSNHDKLLKVAAPRLCQRCHVESGHPSIPRLSTSLYVFNRSCRNCHSQIHGSNHPSGVRFHR